jgi:hypothetical protein
LASNIGLKKIKSDLSKVSFLQTVTAIDKENGLTHFFKADQTNNIAQSLKHYAPK